MKALFIVGPILLIGGVLGAAFMGVVNIPGVTPKKSVAKAQAMYGESAELEPVSEEVAPEEEAIEEPVAPPPAETPKPSAPEADAEKGAMELAKYWGAIPTKSLLPIIENFDEKELALVLQFMPKDKVAEILGKIEPLRAAGLSKELRRLASIVKVDEATDL